jgi:hypothetical protein
MLLMIVVKMIDVTVGIPVLAVLIIATFQKLFAGKVPGLSTAA